MYSGVSSYGLMFRIIIDYKLNDGLKNDTYAIKKNSSNDLQRDFLNPKEWKHICYVISLISRPGLLN